VSELKDAEDAVAAAIAKANASKGADSDVAALIEARAAVKRLRARPAGPVAVVKPAIDAVV